MNLSNEIEEFKKYWSTSGPVTKVFLAVGFFFAVSAVTSLSSEVVKWKGFILEAILFYQSYVVDQVSKYASVWGLTYSRAEIHAAVLLSISVAVGMRILALGQIVAFRIINERYGSNLEPNLKFYWLMGVGFPFATWIFYGFSDLVVRLWFVALIFVIYPAFLVVPKLLSGGDGYLEKGRYNYFIAYYVYLAAIFIVVGVLAAINLGLREPASNKQLDLGYQLHCQLRAVPE